MQMFSLTGKPFGKQLRGDWNMITQGIYNKHGEIFGYLVGEAVYNLDEVQIGYRRANVIYSKEGREQWYIRGDGLYTLQGESVGYLGDRYRETG
jgi:hypothetical protein